MKRFFHPTLKSETLTTSLGKITLDKNGSAEVEDEVFDHLMKNPANAEYQEKLNAQEEPEVKSELTEEDLKLLELPELKLIAKQHKVKFAKDVTKDGIIVSIMDEIKRPPPPPISKPE